MQLDEADDFDPREEPDSWDEDEDSVTVHCPSCGEEVYEDAESCPACGDYIVHNHSVWSDKPWWWIVLGGMGVAAAIWWLLQ